MPAWSPPVAEIVSFLEHIGIAVTAGEVVDSFLPGIAIRNGNLVVDLERGFEPGDLLHEAGHIALCDPAARATLCIVEDGPGEEMAVLAWSYAAALAIGLDPSVLFHANGYRGDGPWLAEQFTSGALIGVPMLQYHGLSAEPHRAEALGLPAYPQMARWLRYLRSSQPA